MKYVKILGLAAVAAMAMMAFAGSASAATHLVGGEPEATLTKGAKIDFSIPSGGSALLVTTKGETLDTCSSSTVQGELETETTGKITALTWSGCTFTTDTVTLGKLKVTGGTETKGTVESDAEIGVTINTVLFGSCVYGVEANKVVGSIAGSPAVFTANAVAIKLSGSNFACPETSKWTGTYNATEPKNLHVEP
jgi:cytoskeletal protein CcmA (bactofilin family)